MAVVAYASDLQGASVCASSPPSVVGQMESTPKAVTVGRRLLARVGIFFRGSERERNVGKPVAAPVEEDEVY